MHWLLVEYLCKGLFLGLLSFVAIKQAGNVPPDWAKTALVAALLVGGLALGLVASAIRYRRDLVRARGRLVPFTLFLLLESPAAVYLGVIFGMIAGAAALSEPTDYRLVLGTITGGAALGITLAILRMMPFRLRLPISFLLAVVGVALADQVFTSSPEWLRDKTALGVHILLGLPFFYLLTFVGHAEESELETAAWCGALAVGLYFVQVTPNIPRLGYLLPLVVYFFYATYILRGVKVFKLALRGYTDLKLGRLRPALEKFRRARQLDPTHRMTREGLWEVHRRIDLRAAEADPGLLDLLDLDVCLERAARMLSAGRPEPAEREEAVRLLDLVATRRPDLKAEIEYYRSLADLHAGQVDAAAGRVAELLDPAAWPADDPSRQRVLLAAWQLALLRHRGLAERVGRPQLELPGRRTEAIATIEDYLSAVPGDTDVHGLRRLVYEHVTEAEYESVVGPSGFALRFGHDFALELGLALIDDPQRWQRGAEYLRMAARGLPERRPSIFAHIAKAAEQAGDIDAARAAYGQAAEFGLALGPTHLQGDDRPAYYAAVKWLAYDADRRDDRDTAIELFRRYREYERAGIETRRRLADLHERNQDVFKAVRYLEEALQYPGASKDADLLERKDRYYNSLDAAALAKLPAEALKGLDYDYCVRKARAILDNPTTEADGIDWAWQLVSVARVLKPSSLVAQVLAARLAFRRGERDEGLRILEDIRCGKPEKFSGAEEEDAWYASCQLLGSIYLDEFEKPELAIEALNDFRKSPKSGADTLYHLGRAYEQLGDSATAAKYFKAVLSYDRHPLYYEAREALSRVGGG